MGDSVAMGTFRKLWSERILDAKDDNKNMFDEGVKELDTQVKMSYLSFTQMKLRLEKLNKMERFTRLRPDLF